MCSVPGLDLWLGCIFRCDEEYFSCSAVWFPCKFSGILRFQSGENWGCSCNGEESLRTPLRTGSWTSRIWKMELSWRKAFLTRLVPMAQKRLMKWKLIGTRKGFLKAQRKPHPWLTCCVSIFEIFLNVPVEFLGQVFQAQFTFKVTAPVCGIESISGFVCGGG